MAMNFTFGFLDNGGEQSGCTVYHSDIATDGTSWLTDQADLVALRDALADVSIGTLSTSGIKLESTVISETLPASPWAQRELGLRVKLSTAAGRTSSFTVPCPDLSVLTVVNDFAVLADGEFMEALVTVLEGGAFVDAVTGDVITSVVSAQVIGRKG